MPFYNLFTERPSYFPHVVMWW